MLCLVTSRHKAWGILVQTLLFVLCFYIFKNYDGQVQNTFCYRKRKTRLVRDKFRLNSSKDLAEITELAQDRKYENPRSRKLPKSHRLRTGTRQGNKSVCQAIRDKKDRKRKYRAVTGTANLAEKDRDERDTNKTGLSQL